MYNMAYTVVDPGFLRRGVNPSGKCANLLFCNAKICMKMKPFGPKRVVCLPSTPPPPDLPLWQHIRFISFQQLGLLASSHCPFTNFNSDSMVIGSERSETLLSPGYSNHGINEWKSICCLHRSVTDLLQFQNLWTNSFYWYKTVDLRCENALRLIKGKILSSPRERHVQTLRPGAWSHRIKIPYG